MRPTTVLSAAGIGVTSGIVGYLAGAGLPTVSVVAGEGDLLSAKIRLIAPTEQDARQIAASICGDDTKISAYETTNFLAVETVRFECAR